MIFSLHDKGGGEPLNEISASPIAAGLDIHKIVAELEKTGLCVIDNCISAHDIAIARLAVERAVHLNNEETVAVFDLKDFSETFLQDLLASPEFKKLCRDISALALGTASADSDLVPSLRCLSGASGQGHSMVFHYDTYVLTVLFPIIIPTEGQTGRLVLLPNTRALRKSYIWNLIDKLLLDNKSAQRRLHNLHERNSARLQFVDLKPGSAYLFWGYRTVHTNEACDADKIRATAIFHYCDPHANSRLKRLLGR